MPRYDEMCRAIAECARVDEAKDFRDKAQALRAYYKQANNTQAEVMFAEVKVRAERKVGDLLIEMAKGGQREHEHQGGDRAWSHDATMLRKTLKSLGIDKHESSRYQRIARIPQRRFESMLKEARESKRPITSASMLAPSPDAKDEINKPRGPRLTLDRRLAHLGVKQTFQPAPSSTVGPAPAAATPPPAPASQEEPAVAAERTAPLVPTMAALCADDPSDSERTAQECLAALERALRYSRTRERLADILVRAGLGDLVDEKLLKEIRLQIELRRLKSRQPTPNIAPPSRS